MVKPVLLGIQVLITSEDVIELRQAHRMLLTHGLNWCGKLYLRLVHPSKKVKPQHLRQTNVFMFVDFQMQKNKFQLFITRERPSPTRSNG